jgi:signal peptidase I
MVAALGAFVGWWIRRGLLVVTVHGVSMSPTYRQGDRLLVRRRRLDRVRRGDVIVLHKTHAAMMDADLIVKRVAATSGDPVPVGIPVADLTVPVGRLVVLGDNPSASYDSRRAGYFDTSTMIGIVLREMNRGRSRA